MAESSAHTQADSGGSLVRSLAKRVLEPLLASVVSAASAYLARKASALAQEKLLPRLQDKGGSRAVAHDTLASVAEKVPEPASGPVVALAEKVGDEENGREAQRRSRERRRNQRRRALEQSGSS